MTRPRGLSAAGPRADRSGARRSQEQGESRMTVLPGARNRKGLALAASLLPRNSGRYSSQRVNKV